jgi:hypothetical protein
MQRNKEFFSQIAQEIVIPANLSVKSQNIYFWGRNNYYPYQLLECFYNSPTHQSLVKSKVGGIMGEGIKVENEANYKEYLKFGNKDLNTIAENIAFDLVLFGGFSMKIVRSVDTRFIHVDNLDFSGVRFSTEKMDDEGNLYEIVYSRDWKNTALKENRKKVYEIYDKNIIQDTSAFVYMKETKAGQRYPRPSYEAALESIICEHEIQLFHLRNLMNNYSPTMIIKLKASMPDEDYKLFKNQLEEKYKGADNAGGILILAGENPETTPDIEFVKPEMQDSVYIEQMAQIKQSILTAHQVTNPSIGGLPSQGAFSSGEEIRISYDLFDRTVISPLRNTVVNSLNTIFENSDWNIGKIELVPTNFDLSVTNNKNTQDQTIVNQ